MWLEKMKKKRLRNENKPCCFMGGSQKTVLMRTGDTFLYMHVNIYIYICTPMHIFAQIIYRICLGNYIG